jgi:hypothetical protein
MWKSAKYEDLMKLLVLNHSVEAAFAIMTA